MNTEVTREQVLVRREETGQLPLLHSVRVQDLLTMRYWDYLAWAVRRARPENLLVLGLGGGTMLQLLERWNYTPPCVGVEVDAALVEAAQAQGWLTYPHLRTVVADARQYVQEQTGRFDVVVVDAYDNQGFVQELYTPPLLERLAGLLTPGGRLLLHCADPAVKYAAFHLRLPRKPASVTASVASDLARIGLTVRIFPLWSTALIEAVAGPAPALPFPEGAPLPLQWLDAFLSLRGRSLEDFGQFVDRYDGPYQYAALDQMDNRALFMLAAGAPEALRPHLEQRFGMQLPPAGQVPPGEELLDSGWCQVSAGTLQGALTLIRLLESPDAGTLEQVPALMAAAAQSHNPAVRMVPSLILARTGQWPQALAALGAATGGVAGG